MVLPKLSRKHLLLLVAVVVVVVAALLWSQGSSSDKTTLPGQPTTSIEAGSFDYPRPANWVKLSKEFLDSNSANSGIGYLNQPVTFMVQVSDSVPSIETELKNSTLKAIQKLENFELISSESTKVDNISGQKFIFRFGGQEKSKKEMNVVVYKNKTYFLLYAAPEADYDKYLADYSSILSGFKFK